MTTLIAQVRRQWVEITGEDGGALAMLVQQARDASSLLVPCSGPDAGGKGVAQTRLSALQRGCRMAQRQPTAIGGESS